MPVRAALGGRGGVRILLACLALLAGAVAVASPAIANSPPPPTLDALTVTGEGRAMYPPFDPDTHHYAVGCGGSGELTLTLSTADPETLVTVNGVSVPNGGALVGMRGLAGDSDVVIRLADAEGGEAVYTVHCLPDDFPTITARRSAEASDMLILAFMRTVGQLDRFIAVLDANGVPRLHRRVDPQAVHAKYHRSGLFPYSYARRGYEAVVLDWDFREVDVVRVVHPLTNFDWHDFVIKPNGNYVLMAYEPARRDLSTARDPDGNPYGATEETDDSVIQEITPDGKQVFLWNSWDHLAVTEDCTQHRFPDDYSHINSLEIVDGDIIASFRGCSQVLRIDGTTGDVIWLLGRSNRSDAEWLASGAPAPLKIVGDPHGEFCGQHAARVRPNGNLVLFDNGSHCQIDPETGAGTRESGAFSRVVEYSLDPATGQAIFQHHHALHGTFDRFTDAHGHVELLPNGNWLVSWGRWSDGDAAPASPPNESITEVDPLTGSVLLSITITSGGRVRHTRAYPLPPDALAWRPASRIWDLEPGWNRIVWRGRDGIPIEDAIREGGATGVTAIHAWDADARSWRGFFPDAPPGVNALATLTAGQRVWIAAR